MRLWLCKHLPAHFHMWPSHAADRTERDVRFFVVVFDSTGPHCQLRERRGKEAGFAFSVGVSQTHVITFTVRGFMTHWLQPQDPCLASDRVLLIPPSQAVKQRSCESCLTVTVSRKKKKKQDADWTHSACQLHLQLHPVLLEKVLSYLGFLDF